MIQISAETDERERCTICRERAKYRFTIEGVNGAHFSCQQHRCVLFGELLNRIDGEEFKRSIELPSLVMGGQGHGNEEAGFCGVAGTACLVGIIIIVGIAVLAGGCL